MVGLKSVLSVALLVGLFAGEAPARQDDERLVPLFEQLLVTNDLSQASLIEKSIWNIWMVSGNERIDLLMLLGVQNMASGQYRQALKLFTLALETDPHYAEAWNKRATVRFLVGDLNGSVSDVGRVLELEPRHFGAFAGLGQIYELKKTPDQAIAAFEKALKINPHMPGVVRKIRLLRLEIDGSKI
ncbi:MAG: tetratricopeptide repeat protein [Sneathiella sp.]